MKNLLLLLVISCIYFTSFSQKKKLLIIGLDGCRADVINNEFSPTMDSIIHLSNTAYSYKMLNERRTMSATNWSSMLTGVHWRKHKARNNNKFYKGNYIKYPPVLKYLKEEIPSLKLASFSSWMDINKYIMRDYIDYAPVEDKDSPDSTIENNILAMLNVVNTDVYDATFIHLEDIDHNGHLKKFSKKNNTYTDAVKRKDDFIKKIFSVIEQRKKRYNENWLVIITTDHGGRKIGKSTGHSFGMINPNIRHAFIIMNGENVSSGKITSPQTIDVAYSCLTFFGINIKPEWNLQGKTIGLKK